MNMPAPDANHERLQTLAATWKGSETMHPSHWDPEGGEAEGRTCGRSALAGFGVVVDYQQRRGGATTFEGHGIYLWDPKAKEVVLHWFDSMGQGREEFRGGWNGERLVLTSKNPMGQARLNYDFSEDGVLLSSMEMSPDGESWALLFNGRYTRE